MGLRHGSSFAFAFGETVVRDLVSPMIAFIDDERCEDHDIQTSRENYGHHDGSKNTFSVSHRDHHVPTKVIKAPQMIS